MKTRISLLALAAALATPQFAQAQSYACDPASPANGETVVCTGSGLGVEDSGLDDASITVTDGAVIEGGSRGLRFDDGVTVVNHGSITGSDDHGIQGDNEVVVENHGTIIGLGGDGVNIDDDGRLVNYGTIISLADDGVQLEENPMVENHGTIEAVDEGINVNVDNAWVLNTGTVTAADDGINAANGAMIRNEGTITSTGAQDAIDLDSGDIYNSGTLQSLGGEDGIDFDEGGTQDSHVWNSGVISGNIGINTDAADTANQHVTNAGVITGTSGTAINLGAGDDSLTVLNGSVITGLIELGDGTDTLVIRATEAQTLSFASLPEIQQLGDNVLFVTPVTVPSTDPSPAAIIPGAAGFAIVADAAALSQSDVLAREIGFGLARDVMNQSAQRGVWLTGSAGMIATDAGDHQDADVRHRNMALGYGLGERTGLSVFIGYGQGSSDLDDGLHESRIRSYSLGLGYERDMGRFTLGGALFAGRTHNVISSPAAASGDADFDGKIYGLSLRGTGLLVDRGEGTGIDLMVQADALRHDTDSFKLSGLGGASFDARSTTATALRVELGMPMMQGGAKLRPYVGLAAYGGEQDTLTMSLMGASTSFDAADVLARKELALGLSFEGAGGDPMDGLSGRFELTGDDAGNTGFSAGFGVRF